MRTSVQLSGDNRGEIARLVYLLTLQSNLELAEHLLGPTLLHDLKDIEANSLGQGAVYRCNWCTKEVEHRPALSNHNLITFFRGEARRAVDRNVTMTLLITVVLPNVVKIVTSNNNGALHLGAANHCTENVAANAHIARERALLVHVVALNGFTRNLEAQAGIAPETKLACGNLLAEHTCAPSKNGFLLLKRTLGL